MSRSSLFFNQWLVSRTGEEVSPKSTFARFKQFVERESGQKVTDLLPTIKQQADLYQAWTIAADSPDRQLTPVELTVYRMRASDVELLKPLLIWLHSPGRDLPQPVIDQVVADAESWVVRRQLLRLTGSDLGRIVAEIIQDHSDAPVSELPVRVRTHLSRLSVSSTYWPGDEEIRQALLTEQAYRRFKRGRLRMLLEAIEDHYRQGTNQPQVARRGYPIEHILPQEWTDNWPVDGLEAEQDRANHVHRLGNLTLLTSNLNSKVSNGRWAGKRAALQQHDTLLMNSRLLAATQQRTWDEDGIDARTSRHVEVLLQVWPVPEGHEGVVIDPQAKAQDWIQIEHLVAANLLAPGTVLTPRAGQWENRIAVVRADGLIELDGKAFDSPSGAGKHVKGGATNGWYFWRLPDGRRLVGTAPQPLGNHVTHCEQCSNAHRILTREGRVAENFTWTDPSDDRAPVELLQSEGLVFEGTADRSRELSSDDLGSLVAD